MRINKRTVLAAPAAFKKISVPSSAKQQCREQNNIKSSILCIYLNGPPIQLAEPFFVETLELQRS